VKHESRFERRHANVSAAIGAMLMLSIYGVGQAQPAGDAGPRIGPPGVGVRKLPPQSPDAPPPSADPRDLAGIWLANENPIAVGGPPGFGPTPPYTPEAAKQQQKVAEMIRQGRPPAESAARCRPSTLFRIAFDVYPGEIVQSADKVVILGEEGRTRWQIFMNRDHPKEVQPTFFGDSVGHWEGNTLVVDTIGLNGQIGTLSPKAHVTSKLRKTDGGKQLELTVIIEDPVNYTKPYQQTVTASWRSDVTMLEYQCEENIEGATEGLLVGQ